VEEALEDSQPAVEEPEAEVLGEGRQNEAHGQASKKA
jgi:hypothetical protein